MLKKLSFLKTWIKKEQVIDVIIFGSSIRSKPYPRDIDLCIIIDPHDEKRSLDLIDSLSLATQKMSEKVQINILKTTDFWQGNTLVKTLFQEGISLRYGKPVSQLTGFENISLFLYTLKHFSPSQRVRFHYMLNGRYGLKGVLKEVEGTLWNAGTIAVPTQKEDLLKHVFDQWKVKYTIKRSLIG